MLTLSTGRIFVILNTALILVSSLCLADDPLPSWNEGPAKASIIDFVEKATENGNPGYIPLPARIATFDQDGTLWVEQPQYAQKHFTIDRLKVAALSPFSKVEKLVKSFLKKLTGSHDMSKKELTQILGFIDLDVSLEGFHAIVQDWLISSEHPDFKKPYTALIYEPMLEVIRYFQKNDFKTYIVSGGGQEFIRAYAEASYQIPPEWIIGSALKVKYKNDDDQIKFVRSGDLLFVNEKEVKAESINLMIGRKPVAAFGNSDGDREMLELTWANKGLVILIHHDDEIREYAYDKDSKVGKLSKDLMNEAKNRNYNVISMKNDWKILFPWQKMLP